MGIIHTFQSLEPRRLLSFDYSMVDLGIVDQPLGSAVLDMDDRGFVLTPTAVWSIKNGKGRKSDINPHFFLAHKLASYGGAVGTLVSTHQAESLKHKAPLDLVPYPIGPLTLQSTSNANALGSRDNAVGRMKGSGAFHAFLANYVGPSSYTDIDLTDELAGRGLDIDNAIDINSANQILLTGRDSQSGLPGAAIATITSRGFRYTPFSGTGSSNEEILPRELNDIGQAAGSIQTQAGSTAVLWSTSRLGVTVTTLPTLGGSESAARGLNNLGLVVGYSTTAAGRQRAIVFDQATGQTTDLNLLVDTQGMSLRIATSVNKSGQIAAEAVDADGKVHAVVLFPTQPYPALTPGVSADIYGTVAVNGTDRGDHINIHQDAKDATRLIVSLNGKETAYNIVDIRLILVHGGAGNDTITVNAPTAYNDFSLFGDHGNDTITGLTNISNFQNTVSGGEGNDRITVSGPQSRWQVSGDGGDDRIESQSGQNVLWGGTGDDFLQADTDPANMQGENGNDTLVGTLGNDVLGGGAGNDSITSFAGNDNIQAGAGDDFVDAGDDNDVIFGGAGNDSILAGNGDDFAYGDEGDDTLLGQSGDDTLAGDIAVTRDTFNFSHAPGNDLLDGGRGRDYLLGSTDLDAGIDTLIGGDKGDILNGRASDSLSDAGIDDIVPRAAVQGTSPFAIDQTATIVLNFPARYPAKYPRDHARSAVTVPTGAGDFPGSPLFVEPDNVIRIRAHLSRDFTLGQFFDNWGIYVDNAHFGGYISPYSSAKHRTVITVNGQPYLRDRAIQSGETLTINVEL